MSIKTGIKDFFNGLSVLFGKPKEGQGDRQLAKMCNIVIAQIKVKGTAAVRKQVVDSIRTDLNRAARKGGKAGVDKMVENALSTPEYRTLLQRLSLGEPEVRVLAMEAVRKYAK